jgi:hypothetical protein
MYGLFTVQVSARNHFYERATKSATPIVSMAEIDVFATSADEARTIALSWLRDRVNYGVDCVSDHGG